MWVLIILAYMLGWSIVYHISLKRDLIGAGTDYAAYAGIALAWPIWFPFYLFAKLGKKITDRYF